MMQFKNKKYVTYGLALGLCLGAFVFIHTNFKNQAPEQSANTTITKVDAVRGFDIGSDVKILYTSAQGIEQKEIATEEGLSFLPISFNTVAQKNYRVDYHISKNNAYYVDVALLINKDKNNISAQISGLSPRQGVSLHIDRVSDNVQTPTDWAGRMTLTKNLGNTIQDKEICLYIGNQKSICHLHNNEGQS